MTELWMLGAFFLFVLAAVSVAGYFVMGRTAGQTAAAEPGPSSLLTTHRQSDGFGGLVRVFEIIGENVPGARAADNPLRAQLIQAGYRLASAVRIFYGIKCASALTFGMLVLGIALWAPADPMLPAICAAAFGFMIPDRVLARVKKARNLRLRRGLPSAMDMLVLAVEAGQSIDQAMVATSRGLKSNYPDLAAELTTLQLEARASNNRTEALRNFASRTKEPELKKFAALLLDTDRFGTSVGPALRDHAKYLRIRFRQEAQETARKVGVKLIFPVFFLIFPSVVLVTLGPAVILIFTQLKGLLGN